VIDHCGRATAVRSNVCTGSCASYVCIKEGAFGAKQDLLIRPGHPLLIDGKEVPCEQLIDGVAVEEVTLERSGKLFTLVTERRTFVEMQGLQVGTWSEDGFATFLENDPAGQRLAIERQ